MAGYNKGIVATRKLNERNKARLGRGGDTEIREVDGRKSHVNALEAYLIDVNGKAGEEYTKRVGSGTVNPLTGMPEYHTEKTYEELAAMTPYEYEVYLGTMGIAGETTTYSSIFGEVYGEETSAGTRQFVGDLSDIRDDPSLKYIQAQKEFATDTAGTTRDLAQKQLEATKGLGMEQLGLERQFTEKGLGQAQEFAKAGAGRQYQTQTADLVSGLASGQRGLGRGFAQGRAGVESVAGRSGLARGLSLIHI